MSGLETIVAVIVAAFLVQQTLAVAVYVVFCRRQVDDQGDWSPPALVVLSLRGPDGRLAECLRALFGQDYPSYVVRVVIDHPSDPAADVVGAVLEEENYSHVQVMQLESPSDTCSLKCSALRQATADLPDDCEIVAFLDADVVPGRDWLRRLARPLVSPRVGATMGNRWYLPPGRHWGSLVRFVWNAASVVTMFFWQVPWGGSLAVKASVLRETDLRERWKRAGCDDVPLFDVLQRRRQRIRVVPSVMLVSREEIDTASCLDFIARQMLWVRLYHPVCWWVSSLWNVLIAAGLVAALVLSLVDLALGRWLAAAVLSAMVGANVLGVAAILSWLQLYTLPAGEAPAPRRSLKFYPAILLTQLLVPWMAWQSLIRRRIEWRGIDYQIDGPWKVRMVQYRPISATPQQPSVWKEGLIQPGD